ncbi:hypothetical protein SANTM175S_00017 [Streptomyces antimycoticus]
MQHTFVAAENKDFFSDSGVSFTGTARGLINTALGRGKQGGSTITQQYVNYTPQRMCPRCCRYTYSCATPHRAGRLRCGSWLKFLHSGGEQVD